MTSRAFALPALLIGIASLSACATIPRGPAVGVMPGTGKTLADFQRDDAVCRHFAESSVGGASAQQASEESVVKSAAVGSALGALAGVAFGGGRGAAIGAGSGLLAGSALGVDAGRGSAYEVQRRYDTAYAQCMTTQGNRSPDYVAMANVAPRRDPRPAPRYDPYYAGPSYGYSFHYGGHHGHHAHRGHHGHHYGHGYRRRGYCH